MPATIEFEAFGPKKLFDVPKIIRELRSATRREGMRKRTMYRKTVNTWKRRPGFKVRIYTRGGDTITSVTYSDRTKAGLIYKFVDYGTESHPIAPRRAALLRFRVGGRPKTRPRYITSYRGRPGRKWVSAKKVQHPGTKAREFSRTLQQRWNKSYPKAMIKAMRGAVMKARTDR